MSPAVRNDGRLIIGGSPRADLMPPSIRQGESARKQRGLLAIIFVAVVVLVGAAYGVAVFVASVAEDQLAAANTRTSELLLEQGDYSEVTNVQSQLDLALAAKEVGGAADVDWSTLIKDLEKALPSGSEIRGIAAQVSSPTVLVDQPASSLYAPRIAKIVLKIGTKNIGDVAKFERKIVTVKGFADVLPESTDLEDGLYETTLTISFNQDVLSGRYSTEVANNE